MNIKLTLAAALLLAATPAFAQSARQGDAKARARSSSGGKMTVVESESLDGDNQSHTIEVRVENGEVTVKRNGKEVPQDQIRREDDGRIIILDANGEELEGVHLFHGGDEDGRVFTGEGVLRGFHLGEGGDDEQGHAPKVMLGVHMTEPGAALEKHLRLNPGKCVMITGVLEGLPAEVAGIGEFDVIVRIDDSDDADAATIRKVLGSKEAGDTVNVRVIQAGDAKDLMVKLQKYDREKLSSAKLIGKQPDATAWAGTGKFDDWTGDLKALAALPQWKNRVFVAPQGGDGAWKDLLPHLNALEGDARIAELQPQIEKALKDAMKNYQGTINRRQVESDGDGDVEGQLDRLDKRMAQLEEMLQKLLEKQDKP